MLNKFDYSKITTLRHESKKLLYLWEPSSHSKIRRLSFALIFNKKHYIGNMTMDHLKSLTYHQPWIRCLNCPQYFERLDDIVSNWLCRFRVHQQNEFWLMQILVVDAASSLWVFSVNTTEQLKIQRSCFFQEQTLMWQVMPNICDI